MKKLNLIILALVSVFISCNDEEANVGIESTDLLRVMTRGSQGKWDECTYCKLPSGAKVFLPWASLAETAIPEDIRYDVKESDGWRLLFSNLKIVGCDHVVNKVDDACYILLYNKLSGVLKGFCYVPKVQPNNSAYWQLTIPQSNTKLFNFIPYFASPNNSSSSQKVVISNVSSNLLHGFDKGWNCFMLELAYDENSLKETMNILAYAMNEVTYKFKGAYKSTSGGTIVTFSRDQLLSGIVSGIVNAVGDSAKNWVARNTVTGDPKTDGGKPIKSKALGAILQLMTGDAGPALLKAGINSIFGSVLGRETKSVQTLQFTTNGSVEITGKSVFPATGYIPPISGIPLNGIGERLGVWNLAEAPKYTINKTPELVNFRDNASGREFWYKVTGTPSMRVVTNPTAGIEVKSHFSLAKYDKYDGKYPNFWTRNTALNDTWLVNVASAGYTQTLLYSDSLAKIWDMPQTYIISSYNNYPNRTTVRDVPAYDFYHGNFEIRQNITFKVVAEMFMNGRAAYSCKTFIPVNEVKNDGSARPYNWTYKDLRSAGYMNRYNY